MIASIRGKKPHVYRVIILKQMADHTSVALSQNKNEQLYKTGSARGDVWLRRISANNVLTLENASGLF